jgi:rod shape-determining protein MreC
MRNLLQLIIKYHAFLLFLLLEIVSFALLANKNSFQHSATFRAANTISSGVYNVTNNIYSYFGLRDINNSLSEENTRLQNQIVALQNQLESRDSTYIPADNNLDYIEAEVINNSVNKPNNYITINKGIRDGIAVDMGVVSVDGVVGIVSAVSNQFAIVETLLNNKASINAIIRKNGEVGQLKWDGTSYAYAYLEDIPRHVNVSEGDTIVTSGFSNIFPKDIMIGVVETAKLTDADATYTLKVKLATNFKNTKYVKVIRNNNIAELKDLQQHAEK